VWTQLQGIGSAFLQPPLLLVDLGVWVPWSMPCLNSTPILFVLFIPLSWTQGYGHNNINDVGQMGIKSYQMDVLF
jgi:hypothetical protein